MSEINEVIDTQRLRIKASLGCDEVNWPLALSTLISRFNIPFDDASKMLVRFRNELMRPLGLYWFVKSRLSDPYKTVVLAICQAHGVDQIHLTQTRKIKVGIVGVDYEQELTLVPRLDSQVKRNKPEIYNVRQRISLLGLDIDIRTRQKLLLVQLLLAALAAVTFSLFAGLILYGLSVFMIFLMSPATMTIAATRNASLGIALMCTLIGISGIFGRAIANVTRESYLRILKQRSLR